MNEDNEWLEFLMAGMKKKPTLKLKPRPKTRRVSIQQRRIHG